MRIGIISDTHNNVENLHKALNRLQQEDIITIFHCGDLTDPETARLLDGFQVYFTYGNGDTVTGKIREMLLSYNPTSWTGFTFTGDVNGVSVAATHGHLDGMVDQLTQSGKYAYVFKGHSHRRLDVIKNGTRLINPGSLGGLKVEPRGFCILDLTSGQLDFIEVGS